MSDDDAEKKRFEQLIKDEIDRERSEKMKKGLGALFWIVALFLFALWGVTGLILAIIYFFTNLV